MFEWDHWVSNGWSADTWCLGKHIDEWCDPADRAQRQRELGGHRQHGERSSRRLKIAMHAGPGQTGQAGHSRR